MKGKSKEKTKKTLKNTKEDTGNKANGDNKEDVERLRFVELAN